LKVSEPLSKIVDAGALNPVSPAARLVFCRAPALYFAVHR
jgi:hypothetical protein